MNIKNIVVYITILNLFGNHTIKVADKAHDKNHQYRSSFPISNLLDEDRYRYRTPSPNIPLMLFFDERIYQSEQDIKKIKKILYIHNHTKNALLKSRQGLQEKNQDRIIKRSLIFYEILKKLPSIILEDNHAMNKEIKKFFKDKRLYYSALLLPKN